MPVRLWAHSVIIRGMSGTSELVQHVGQAIDGDRLQARVAEDHLVERLAGRVAVVGGLDVQWPGLRAARAAARETRIVFAWPRASKSLRLLGLHVTVRARLVAQRPGDLDR